MEVDGSAARGGVVRKQPMAPIPAGARGLGEAPLVQSGGRFELDVDRSCDLLPDNLCLSDKSITALLSLMISCSYPACAMCEPRIVKGGLGRDHHVREHLDRVLYLRRREERMLPQCLPLIGLHLRPRQL